MKVRGGVAYRLAAEKCAEPRKPRCALSGEGWAQRRTRCVEPSMRTALRWAVAPL